MKVGIFFTSINDWKSSEIKTKVMNNFGLGVKNCGDDIINFKDPATKIENIDAGFILGYTLENNFRRKIINNLESRNIPRIYIDSDVFVYGKKNINCFRYSVNGVYPTDGEYFLTTEFDKEKTKLLLDLHGIKVKPWRKTGEHILVLGQRTLGWNMLGNNGMKWIYEVVERIKQHTDRPIVIRLHPGDSSFNKTNVHKLNKRYNGSVTISKKEHLISDLENAWCCVGYNSTPNCASAIEGVPVYLDSPDHSWAKEIGFSDLSLIENPPMPDRENWLDKIAHIHYTDDEIVSGFYWKRYKEFYKI
jgi:hypothetical protein